MKTPVLRPPPHHLWPRTGSQCGSNPARWWIHSGPETRSGPSAARRGNPVLPPRSVHHQAGAEQNLRTSSSGRYFRVCRSIPKAQLSSRRSPVTVICTGLRPARRLDARFPLRDPISASLENATLSPPRQPRDKAGFAEPFHHVLQMRAVARFNHDFEQGALGGQVGERALVRDLDDVGAGFGE
jgi:hypothetical protein